MLYIELFSEFTMSSDRYFRDALIALTTLGIAHGAFAQSSRVTMQGCAEKVQSISDNNDFIAAARKCLKDAPDMPKTTASSLERIRAFSIRLDSVTANAAKKAGLTGDQIARFNLAASLAFGEMLSQEVTNEMRRIHNRLHGFRVNSR
jgi:hypothetical protein